MYKNKRVEHTLSGEFMTPLLKKAQAAEFIELKKRIDEVYKKFKQPIKILDIGIGDARIPILLNKTDSWRKIKLYIGIDNSLKYINHAKKVIKKRKLCNKVRIIFYDAIKLDKKNNNEVFRYKYELIISTYFTPGNFKPKGIELIRGKDGLILPYNYKLLEPNKNFVKVFRGAYNLLNPSGRIILGSIYLDNEKNIKRQEDFYKKCGMHVITSQKDPFSATKEGFWSQRFTKGRIYNYFSWVKRENIRFIPLDNYNFAQMISISK